MTENVRSPLKENLDELMTGVKSPFSPDVVRKRTANAHASNMRELQAVKAGDVLKSSPKVRCDDVDWASAATSPTGVLSPGARKRHAEESEWADGAAWAEEEQVTSPKRRRTEGGAWAASTPTKAASSSGTPTLGGSRQGTPRPVAVPRRCVAVVEAAASPRSSAPRLLRSASRRSNASLERAALEPNLKRVEELRELLCGEHSQQFAAAIQALAGETDGDDVTSAMIAVLGAASGSAASVRVLANAIDGEVLKTSDQGTLFRGNSAAARLVSTYLRMSLKGYVQDTLSAVVEDICFSSLELEVDPARAKPGADVADARTKIEAMARAVLTSVASRASAFPVGARSVLRHLCEATAQKFPDMRLKIVGGFVFLRVLCPALIAAQEWGIIPRLTVAGPPTPEARRILVVLCKILQNISNGLEFGEKESFMTPFNPLINAALPEMTEYLGSLVAGEDCAAEDSTTDAWLGDVGVPGGLLDLQALLARHGDRFRDLLLGVGAPAAYADKVLRAFDEVPERCDLDRMFRGAAKASKRLEKMMGRERARLDREQQREERRLSLSAASASSVAPKHKRLAQAASLISSSKRSLMSRVASGSLESLPVDSPRKRKTKK